MGMIEMGGENSVFVGDSGNDLIELISGLKAILVHNAATEVKAEAQQRVAAAGYPECLYLSKGKFMGMNGNYAAGVLEGLVHFFPESIAWLEGGKP
jgi:hypothetical protein